MAREPDTVRGSEPVQGPEGDTGGREQRVLGQQQPRRPGPGVLPWQI